MRIPPLLFLALLLLPRVSASQEESKPSKKPSHPAFDFLTDPKVKISIHKAEIKRGIREPGDPRDKLPPIYKPKILSIKEGEKFLRGNSRVLGIVVGDEARAYPLLLMRIHEVVNDTLGGRPIAPNY